MTDDVFVPESKALKRFEMTRGNASYHYSRSNTVQPSLEDINELCAALVAMVGQLAEGLALAQKEADATSERVRLLYHQLPMMIRGIGGNLDDIRNKLPKR